MESKNNNEQNNTAIYKTKTQLLCEMDEASCSDVQLKTVP